MKKRMKKYLSLFIILIMGIVVLGCEFPGLSSNQAGKDTIKITALSTTESQVIANIISQLIQHDTNYGTTIVNNLGSSSLEHQALIRHDADIEAAAYNGNLLTTVLASDPIKNSPEATKVVRKKLKNQYDQNYFPTYGFADTFAFMVKPNVAKQYGLNDISDLQKVQDKFTFGVPSDWPNRKGDGFNDYSRVYKTDFDKVYPMSPGLVYSALQKNQMNVVLGYSTDGRIDSYHLKLLNDDKHFFPPYNSSMVVNNQILEKHPDLKPVLHKLDGQLDIRTVRKMNYQVDNQLLEPSVVAHNFLIKNKYFDNK